MESNNIVQLSASDIARVVERWRLAEAVVDAVIDTGLSGCRPTGPVSHNDMYSLNNGDVQKLCDALKDYMKTVEPNK